MFRLMLLITFTFSLSSIAYADTFKGRIRKINDVVLLITKTQVAYTLQFSNKVSQQQISRLNNNDFASVTANFDITNPSRIVVSSVDYVGLSDLVGMWRSDVNLCYEFAGFTKLYVFAPNQANECLRSTDADLSTKYTYFINPDVDAWNMLISSSDSEFVGELKIVTTNRLEIMLFDSQTDAILGTIVLRR